MVQRLARKLQRIAGQGQGRRSDEAICRSRSTQGLRALIAHYLAVLDYERHHTHAPNITQGIALHGDHVS